MDTEINCRIGKASGNFSRLSGRFWEKLKLTIRTKSAVYLSCVCSTLLYGSETWILSTINEKKINTLYQWWIRRIPKIKWQHNSTYIYTIYTTFSQRRLRCLGHVLRMSDKCIAKALPYSELVVGKHNLGQPKLRYKCDFKSLKTVDIDEWERLTNDRNK